MKTLLKKRYLILFLMIFCANIFLRFYEIEVRNPFGWDQVDNAWAAKNILVEHKFLLLGMQAKLNSGIFIGPLYYHLISIVYFLTNLDPIASGIFAGLTSIFLFFTLFYIAKKLFSVQIAVIAIFINTVSFTGIMFDRIQWPVNFIPAVSLIILYSLYRIITGQPKYLFLLALGVGSSFHIHFTAIFFPILILLALPFFPKTKATLKYGFFALLLFLIFLIPSTIAYLQNTQHASNFLQYSQTYYHGFHLTRVLQLSGDAFIQFEPFLFSQPLRLNKGIVLLIFTIVYLIVKPTKEKFRLIYLIWLWFLIPWLIFAMYSGEISDYYFSINRFIALLVLAFLIGELYRVKNWLVKVAIVIFLIYYASFNINQFLATNNNKSLKVYKENVRQAIKESRVIQFQEDAPESYLYYIYTRKK